MNSRDFFKDRVKWINNFIDFNLASHRCGPSQSKNKMKRTNFENALLPSSLLLTFHRSTVYRSILYLDNDSVQSILPYYYGPLELTAIAMFSDQFICCDGNSMETCTCPSGQDHRNVSQVAGSRDCSPTTRSCRIGRPIRRFPSSSGTEDNNRVLVVCVQWQGE